MTQLVGILNVTPDSFSDGGKYETFEDAIKHAEEMFKEGAAIVDVGAESTRPGAEQLTPAVEWRRLEPVLKELAKRFSGKLSVDTYHPQTATKVLVLGNIIINDVTGMNNPAMIDTVSRAKARVIVSHLPGADIQAAHKSDLIDSVDTVKNDLLAKAAELKERGVTDIILDPGIGFGKTPELNRKLVEFAREVPDFPVMIGYSRKRFLGDKRMELEPNLEAGRAAIAAGAAYLRVHDVAGHRQLLY
jgi:dihydropteroate synthase